MTGELVTYQGIKQDNIKSKLTVDKSLNFRLGF
jgi:hypothetical protein